jgi:hypothetical protein
MRSRCMGVLPRTTLHSDSEQYLIFIFFVNLSYFVHLPSSPPPPNVKNTKFLGMKMCISLFKDDTDVNR